jgi:hypothetical protein
MKICYDCIKNIHKKSPSQLSVVYFYRGDGDFWVSRGASRLRDRYIYCIMVCFTRYDQLVYTFYRYIVFIVYLWCICVFVWVKTAYHKVDVCIISYIIVYVKKKIGITFQRWVYTLFLSSAAADPFILRYILVFLVYIIFVRYVL